MRLAAVLALLLVLSSEPRSSLPEDQQIQPQTTEHHSNHSHYHTQATTLSPVTESASVVQTMITPEHETETQSKQKTANDSAKWWFFKPEWMMVWLTLIYVVVSTFTLRTIIRQSRIAETAAKSALRNARTASKTLDLTRDTAKRQLRAYVLPTKAYRIQRQDATWVVVEIKNSGSTPAYNYRGFVATDICERGQQRENIELPTGVETSQAIIPPSATLELGGPMTDLTPQQVLDISAGRKTIYVHGDITYTDAFDETRFAKFRFECTGELLSLGRFMACPQGNEAN
jgi:hypothetical protein